MTKPQPAVMLELDPHGRVMMQRDMELVRRILLSVEARPDLKLAMIRLPGEEAVKLARHVEMLVKSGLVDARQVNRGSSPLPQYLVSDLSWDGHDFLAALKNETVWRKLKAALSAKDMAELPLAIIKDLASDIIRKVLRGELGLP